MFEFFILISHKGSLSLFKNGCKVRVILLFLFGKIGKTKEEGESKRFKNPKRCRCSYFAITHDFDYSHPCVEKPRVEVGRTIFQHPITWISGNMGF
ncbi:MAG: hypothetical protein C4329_04640 [Chitinophagaceae bacterium]